MLNQKYLFNIYAILALVAIAIALPVTLDELDRLKKVSDFIENGILDMKWPPGSLFIPFLSKILGQDYLFARLVGVTAFLISFLLLIKKYKLNLNNFSYIKYIFVPFIGLVVSTSMQQGLMITLFNLIIINYEKKLFSILLLNLLYLTNPAMIGILLLTTIFIHIFTVIDKTELRKLMQIFFGSFALWLLIVMTYFLITHDFLLSMSNNGPGNLFLGNNPHPRSFFGVAEVANLDLFNGEGISKGKELFINYVSNNPTDFLIGIFAKFLLFFLPIDYLRDSSMLVSLALQFVALSIDISLIYIFFRNRSILFKNEYLDKLKIIVCIYISAAIVYSLFFVKIRFSIPFDYLIMILLPYLETHKNTLQRSFVKYKPRGESY